MNEIKLMSLCSNCYHNKVCKYKSCDKEDCSYYKNKIEIFKNIIVSLGINIILYLGIILVKQGSMELSNLILFYSIMIYFIEPLNDIVLIRTIFKNGRVDYNDFLNTIFHELIHGIQFTLFGSTPEWLNEGIAKYLDGTYSKGIKWLLDNYINNNPIPKNKDKP